MLGHTFNNHTLRKYIVVFGSLFKDMTITRTDSNGTVLRTIKVPLSYAPKERYLTRQQTNPDLKRQIDLSLPRMAFQMKSMTYDPDRRLNAIGQLTSVGTSANQLTTMYNPVPWNINMDLAIITRNTSDMLQIIEQILPFFGPVWTESVNLMPGQPATSIPIVLNSSVIDDEYIGDPLTKEYMIWDLGFTIKGYLYGPQSQQGVIKDVIVNMYTPTTNTAAEGVGITDPLVRIEVTPGLTFDGKPTSNASLSIPSANIQSTDDYGFITDIEEFF